MNQTDYSPVISTLNGCVAQFYSADQYDLATLGSILAKLDEIHDECHVNEEFKSSLGAFVAELEQAMLSESALPIIQDGPTMLSALIAMIPGSSLVCSANIDHKVCELSDIQLQFVQENIGIIQDKIDQFEDLTLSVEQENTRDCWDSITSVIHGLKGDFGVLGLSSFVKVLHRLEDSLAEVQEKQSLIPLLFGVRDLIAGRLSEIVSGDYTTIAHEEIDMLFSQKIKSQSSVIAKQGHSLMSTTLVVDAESDLLMEFVTESKEHMIAAESALMELENNPNDSELIDAAFRACHTVKGVAGFLNLKPVQELAHSLESVMDAGRTGKLSFKSDILTLLLQGFDFLGELIDQIESLLPSGKIDINSEILNVYEQLTDLSESIKSGISPEKNPPIKNHEEPIIEIEQTFSKESQTEQVNIIPVKSVEPEKSYQNTQQRSTSDQNQSKVEETVRVSVQRLDRLIDSIGEIVIAQSMLTSDPDFVKMKSRSVEQKSSQISIVMRQIQEEAMSLRMVSLRSTFQKMSRLVRDLSQKMDKPVEFIVTGEDTELDKSIIEHISDPLVHMLRNSLDHGVESQNERRDAGKEPIGTVELRAYHKSGNVVIDIVDDGRGLCKQKLLQKAIANGIANPRHEYSEQEIYQFIFAPGFSTAAEITDISGRGVGMDVVKRNILGMRGSLEIHSDEGKGTCFSIKLPLTMAIIDGMIVHSGSETLIIPTLSIVSTVNPKADQIQTVRGKGEMISLHNQLYRFVRLSDLLGIECERRSATEGIAIILENIVGNRIALWVNGIVKKQQVVIKSLGQLFRNYKWISGGAVLGDGKINIIIDVNELFQMVEK